MGVTPIDIPMMAGSYTLSLRKQGYLDQNFETTINKTEIALVTKELRRRTVDLPLSVNAPGTTVFINGQEAGPALTYNKWLESLPRDKQLDLSTITSAWKKDSATIGFFRIPDIRIGQEFKVELRAPCYESFSITLSVKEEDVVDWNRPVVSLMPLRLVELKKDLGFVEVSSNPPGGEAWIDNVFQGKTPVSKDLCSGAHRVQVVHRSGQYVQEVNVRRGQVAKVQGELKPAIAFLGVYESAPANPIPADWEKVAKRLVLRITTFSDPQITVEEIDTLRKKSSPSFERLLDPQISMTDLDMLIKKAATDAGRVDLILIGRKIENKYQFRLFSTLHPLPDIIEIPNLEDESLDFLVSNINKANQAGSRLQFTTIGLDLLESSKGLVVLKASGDENKAIKPGAVIRSVDRKPMNYAEFWNYFRTRKPSQPISYEISSDKETTENVTTVPRLSGMEYPWHSPDGFPNAVLVMLNNLVESDPLSDRAKFANLSLARGLMQYGEWKLALEVLAKTNLEPHKSGICPGTVLYLQARCYEELGDRVMAESLYIRTKDYPEATIETPEGLSILTLSEQRMQLMKKSTR
jgi:hypothetical protein